MLTKSYMWVHTVSELLDCPPVIVFCYGAKVNAIMYSIVETAKANHANVQYYLQYLFEQIPRRRAEGDTGFMEEMMPWSEIGRAHV